jgi:hypothetical protein
MSPVHLCWERLTRGKGSQGPLCRAPSFRVKEHFQTLEVWEGMRIRGVEGESSREAETQERIDLRLGATRVGVNGLAGGVKLRSG